jgi:uncharacterized membrane protein
MQLTPLIAVHMGCAIAATAIGPVALWARRSGAKARPRLHRAAGHAFVLLMLATAITALFIRDHKLPNWQGFTPIHLLIPLTLAALAYAFWSLGRGRIAQHSRTMRRVYFGACVTAGLFTLVPGRLIGDWFWQRVLAS